MRSGMDEAMAGGLARLFLVEEEHALVLREAELSWVRGLVGEIRGGTLEGLREWESFYPAPDAAEEGPDSQDTAEGGAGG